MTKIARNFMIDAENANFLKNFPSMSQYVDDLITAARKGTEKSDLDRWNELAEEANRANAKAQAEQAKREKAERILAIQKEEFDAVEMLNKRRQAALDAGNKDLAKSLREQIIEMDKIFKDKIKAEMNEA